MKLASLLLVVELSMLKGGILITLRIFILMNLDSLVGEFALVVI